MGFNHQRMSRRQGFVFLALTHRIQSNRSQTAPCFDAPLVTNLICVSLLLIVYLKPFYYEQLNNRILKVSYPFRTFFKRP